MTRSLRSLAVSWGPALLWAALIFGLSASSHPPGSGLFDRIPAGDKLGHLVLYSVLGAALAWARRSHFAGAAAPVWIHLALVLLGALYGLSDEWHQSFVPDREVSALDWLADLCGVTLGYAVASAPILDPESD